MDLFPRRTTFDAPPTPDEEELMVTPATFPARELMKVGVLDGGQQFGIDFLDIVAQSLLVATYAKGRDDSAFKRDTLFAENDLESSAFADCLTDNLIAKAVEFKTGVFHFARDCEGKPAFGIGGRSCCRAFDKYRDSRHSGSAFILYDAAELVGFRLEKLFQIDVVPDNSPRDFQRSEEFFADIFDAFLRNADADFCGKIDIVTAVEQIRRLRLNFADHFFERNVIEFQFYLYIPLRCRIEIDSK